MSPSRLRDVIGKAWNYSLEAMGRPGRLPLIVWHTLFHHVHLAEYLHLLRYERWLREAGIRTVLDVGAHCGEFMSAIRVLLPSVRGYGFEPLPQCYQRLSARFRGGGSFRAFNVALGDRSQLAEFYRSDFSKSSSLLEMDELHREAFPWSRKCERMQVQVKRLDEVLPDLELEQRVLLKIDVQGYEDRVLYGSRRTLDAVHYLIVEVFYRPLYRGQASFEDIYAFLRERGFDFAGNFDQLRSPIKDEILQGDALFVRR